jgi:hypothetical protein
MTDKTEIQPAPKAPPVSNAVPTAETLMQAGDALSKSLLFTLERDYLDTPVFDNGSMRMVPEANHPSLDLAFLEVEQVGSRSRKKAGTTSAPSRPRWEPATTRVIHSCSSLPATA